MSEYTALIEAANALVELLRSELTPEPISKPDVISLCSPHEPEDNQLTVYMFHMEPDADNTKFGYYGVGQNVERLQPAHLKGYFLITAHSKAPAKLREADRLRMIGRVIQALNDTPELTLENGTVLKIAMMKPGYEQMMKIWDNNNTPYKLSVAVEITGISISSRRTRTISRVKEVTIDVTEHRGEP